MAPSSARPHSVSACLNLSAPGDVITVHAVLRYPGFRIRSDATGLLRGFEPMPATFLRFFESRQGATRAVEERSRPSQCLTLPFFLHLRTGIRTLSLTRDSSPFSFSFFCFSTTSLCNYFSKPIADGRLREEKSSTFEILG